ncbi:lytic transglycosylase domain-containing protein [Pararhizobium mangrovi]|uniref:Lytic transglycosylase domain-containing protein n=2 Tax=Pararhizobium mangrovi TaxID=2590452 RepID=A0A506U0D2_9HYPH|nr:lytic transglycosylase domain-containing protein [Pararhizobium mangrovi]
MRPLPLRGRVCWPIALALGITLCPLSGRPIPAAVAQTAPADAPRIVVRPADPYVAFVTEAAARFGIPERWIRVVMRAESAGDVHAVSPVGAIGLMQLMPATWAEMRARYRLGTDPFDPRDNILAGAAYLREMHDRFGSPGFLAAYNAGPARYLASRTTGRPLPLETRLYLARLAPLLGDGVPSDVRNSAVAAAPDPLAWTRSPLFVAPSNHDLPDRSTTLAAPSDGSRRAKATPSKRSVRSPANSRETDVQTTDQTSPEPMFVSRTEAPQ